MRLRPESERSDWTDTDLLTKDEARERLQEAVDQLAAEIEARRVDGSSPMQVADLEAQLARFREALEDFDNR